MRAEIFDGRNRIVIRLSVIIAAKTDAIVPPVDQNQVVRCGLRLQLGRHDIHVGLSKMERLPGWINTDAHDRESEDPAREKRPFPRPAGREHDLDARRRKRRKSDVIPGLGQVTENADEPGVANGADHESREPKKDALGFCLIVRVC